MRPHPDFAAVAIPGRVRLGPFGLRPLGPADLEEDMAAIRAARDAEFDVLFLTHMIAHHEGAIGMVDDLLSDTTNAQAKALGRAIITAQTAEIAEMTVLLAE